jgi:lipopolysaccharide heptosyltransferase II
MTAATVIDLHPAANTAAPVGSSSRAKIWRGVQRVLCIRVDNLGDVLMTTPALAAAAASVPGVELTLLGGPGAAALSPHLPMLHDVIEARVPWVRHPDGQGAEDEMALIARLAARRFDAAVIFTVCTQSALPAALLCRLAGIPLRLAHSRENPYELLSDWVADSDVSIDSARHEVRRQLDLVARVGWRDGDERLRFSLRDEDAARVDALLEQDGRLGPLVVLHVGATAASRRWPAERFGAVADELARRLGARIVFTGSESEQPLVNVARGAMAAPACSLAGKLSLGELGALLARADVVVTNNSGPAHLAAAVGTPVVDLYALTNPQHTPWQVPHRTLFADVPCRYCYKSMCPQGHHRCLEDVPAAQAVRAALALLRGDPDGVPAVELPWPGAGMPHAAAAAPAPDDAVPAMPQTSSTSHIPLDEAAHVHPWH